MTYQPHPIDTAGIELPAELVELTERLAESTHDLWAEKRLAEGWKYGPHKDDIALTTPLLVPYPDLPESEKDYDRAIAMATLKAIISLGFEIRRPGRAGHAEEPGG
jgi:hypothetical protein